jgi:hypothetical protein
MLNPEPVVSGAVSGVASIAGFWQELVREGGKPACRRPDAAHRAFDATSRLEAYGRQRAAGESNGRHDPSRGKELAI